MRSTRSRRCWPQTPKWTSSSTRRNWQRRSTSRLASRLRNGGNSNGIIWSNNDRALCRQARRTTPRWRRAARIQRRARLPSRIPGGAGAGASFGTRLHRLAGASSEVVADPAAILARFHGGRSSALGGIRPVHRLQRRLFHVADVFRFRSVRMVESQAQRELELRPRATAPPRYSVSVRGSRDRSDRILSVVPADDRPAQDRRLYSRLAVIRRLA